MNQALKRKVAVVGSGLVGIVLAISLKRKGYDVAVYDKSKDIRTLDFKGRSINLALSHRGWKTLAMAGLKEEVMKLGIPMKGRAIHLVNESAKYQPYSVEGHSIWAVSRGDLNKKLVEIAENMGVEFHFETPIWDLDLDKKVLFTAKKEQEQWKEIPYDLVFGADGAYSRVRLRLQKRQGFGLSQEYLKLGYKEFIIPANAQGGYQLNPNEFHIWPRKDFMFIALANTDGTFTCTLFMPYEGDVSFDRVKTKEDVEAFFAQYFPDLPGMMPLYVDMYQENRVNSLVTIKCNPWVFKGDVALIGDAAHAVVPFYGQGLNAGLEDVSVLHEIIEQEGEDWHNILCRYQQERKPNGDAIAELSFRNFKEMSEDTTDASFLLRKEIEQWFAAKHPGLWLPLYDRVTFSDESYVSALSLGDQQRKVMDEVMKTANLIELLGTKSLEEIIIKLLQ